MVAIEDRTRKSYIVMKMAFRGNVITYRTCLQRNIKVKEKLLHEMLVMKLIEITSLLFLKYNFSQYISFYIPISIILCLTNALNYGLDVTVHWSISFVFVYVHLLHAYFFLGLWLIISLHDDKLAQQRKVDRY